jgi:hypothetical protein
VARVEARETLAAQGLTVLRTEIPQSQALALSFGSPMSAAHAGLYADLLAEVEEVAA